MVNGDVSIAVSRVKRLRKWMNLLFILKVDIEWKADSKIYGKDRKNDTE